VLTPDEVATAAPEPTVPEPTATAAPEPTATAAPRPVRPGGGQKPAPKPKPKPNPKPKAKAKPEPSPAPAVRPELPVPGYDGLSLPSLRARLRSLDVAQLRVLVEYEKSAARRQEVVTMFERRIARLEAAAPDAS
jgi:outer membrane biosynthesis protein TonB